MRQQAGQRLEQRALARAVRPQEREHLSGVGFQVDVVKHGSAPKGDAHAAGAKARVPVTVTHMPAPGEA
jgi:hypothetical protein